jgi:hypothetical protein
MSELNRGLVDRCSMEWLIRRIHRMGGTVEMRIALGDAGRKWQSDRLPRSERRPRRARKGVSDPTETPRWMDVIWDSHSNFGMRASHEHPTPPTSAHAHASFQFWNEAPYGKSMSLAASPSPRRYKVSVNALNT